MIGRFARLFRTSIHRKFNLILSLVLLLLLGGGMSMLVLQEMKVLDRNLKEMGRNLGQLLSHSSEDFILVKDIMRLDAMMEDTKNVNEILYVFILDGGGKGLTSVEGSFKTSIPEVRKIVAAAGDASLTQLAERVRARLDVTEVSSAITADDKLLGTVVVGLWRQGIREAMVGSARLIFVIGACIMLAVIVTMTVMFRRLVSRPLREMVQVASDIASGNLTRRGGVDSEDEIGVLSSAMDAMAEGLTGIIRRLNTAAGQTVAAATAVSASSGRLSEGAREQTESVTSASSSIQEMRAAFKDIANGTAYLQEQNEQTSSTILQMMTSLGELARQAEGLAVSVEETSAALTEMSAGIREIAGSTHEMSGSADQVVSTVSEMSASIREVERLSGESSQAAERVVQEASGSGLAAVGKTMEGMDRIQATVGRSASIVKQLDKRANDVGDILTVINDITDTTSLLALNASILAAQAGEHGRAFGVVAAEIRELAERTNASTREIAAITKAVRADVNMAVEAMGESMGSVAEGTSLASAAERTLRNIIERAEVSRDMGRKIASVTQEQARGMAHVGQTVDGMSQVIRQVNKAIQEQKVGSEMMSRTSEGMRTITEKVKLVAREHATAGQNIVRAVESIRDRVRAIHTATREQEAGSGVVTDSIERINAVLHEFNGMIGGLSSTASSLQKEAEDLRQEISRFNL